MKKVFKSMLWTFLGFLIICSIITVMLFKSMAGGIYAINLHPEQITETHHTFRLYNSWLDAIRNVDYIAECKLGINPETGDYNVLTDNISYNRQLFRRWISACKVKPELFKMEKLRELTH